MAALRLDRIAAATGGNFLQGSGEAVAAGFVVDSRLVRPGDLFFAVVADRDGHDYAADAAARGAVGAVVSRPVAGLPAGFALIRTPDTVQALQALARSVLAERPVKVVAVTGSVGKTTTKEFTAAILARRFDVLKSGGNFNNHLGLALSILGLQPHHTAAVLEMGMRAAGEIRILASIAPPDVAVITNVNPAHLEFLGSLERIAAAKWELVEGLKSGGAAVINGDDPQLRRRAAARNGRTILFGRGGNVEVGAEDVVRRGFDGYGFRLRLGTRTVPCRLGFLTDGYLSNALAASAAAHALGVPPEEIAAAVVGLHPAPGRGGWIRLAGGGILVDDSYNSNPAALAAALQGLAGLPAARRVAILGDMLELGPGEDGFHEEAGRIAAAAGWDVLITIGPRSRHLAEAAVAGGMDPAAVRNVETSDLAAEALAGILRPGDLVLVKGSRGMRTETAAARVKDLFKEA
ncbi:MAG: UDP-N-acetylmuramoyl-tripeptide--D-alanyl-D-alanine ligase [Candidatus Aminicenantes bacterium]|nr:UDP-N-acetylmuramoyl-tripeptide--D-alanyl-D-alanine ligase [Candidatus Aminicenantes bacterium]